MPVNTQAINAKIGLISGDKHSEPMQRSLQAADLHRLKLRLDKIKSQSASSSPKPSPAQGHASLASETLQQGEDVVAALDAESRLVLSHILASAELDRGFQCRFITSTEAFGV